MTKVTTALAVAVLVEVLAMCLPGSALVLALCGAAVVIGLLACRWMALETSRKLRQTCSQTNSVDQYGSPTVHY
jgi:hypothetical protein